MSMAKLLVYQGVMDFNGKSWAPQRLLHQSVVGISQHPADADWYASTSETVHVLSQKTAKQEELFGEPHVPASSDLPVIWGSHPAFHEMTIMTIYFTLCGCF